MDCDSPCRLNLKTEWLNSMGPVAPKLGYGEVCAGQIQEGGQELLGALLARLRSHRLRGEALQ